jgi:hypothetical protein
MSGTHFIIYAARHGAKSFFEGISDPTFFATINRIFDDGYYKEYKDPRYGEVFCFESLREFVTSPNGLDIADWLPFMKALQAQDNGSAAKDLYWRMVKLDVMLDPLVGSVSELGAAPKEGMQTVNPLGRRGKELGYDSNVVHRGNSEEYLVRRLKRDAPELAGALAQGEFPSARAAGIAAGFVKPSPPSLQLKDPAPTAQKLLAKMGKEWCDQFLDELEALMLEV